MDTVNDALNTLRERLPVGSTVRTTVTHVSQSGMMRVIRLFDPQYRDISWLVSRAAGFREHKRHLGVVVGGAGMDMGFHVVYSLSRTLFPNGHPCTGSDGRADYHADQILRVVQDGPGRDEDFYRLKVTGKSESKWLNVNETVLRELAAKLDTPRCPSNEHFNDHTLPYRTDIVHHDGGYALNQAWL